MKPFSTDVPPLSDATGASVFATVDAVEYMPAMDAPPERPHPFAYAVTIQNRSARAVRVVGRKWVVREADGRVTVVEGDGVVGQMPRIEPGSSFSYQSYHVVAADAVAEGAYLAVNDEASSLVIRVPAFRLVVPS